MNKFSRFLILLVIVALAACNRPQPTDQVTDSPAPPPQETDTAVPVEPTDPPPTEEQAEPTEEGPTLEPPPTVDLDEIIQGERIPLLSAGTNISLEQITMVDESNGWGKGTAGSTTRHIFKTADGGKTWRDVTPPQPALLNQGGVINAEYAAWDADRAWAAYGGAEYIWRTTDGGATWQPASLAFMTTYDGLITILDEDHIWFFQFLEGGMMKVFTAVSRSRDGGITWELLLDPYTDATIQAFDKTGSVFITPDVGWLTRDFRGVDPFVRLNLTNDGGFTWDSLEIPPPPPLPNLFEQDLAGLYDPYLIAPGAGYFRLFCRYFENDQMIDRDFLYKTFDGGETWEILEAPRGEIYYINEQVMYSVSREIYTSIDAGASWKLIKEVNWDGEFSFIDQFTAVGVAYDPDDDEYALVKTIDGFNSIQIIEPVVIAPFSTR